MESMNDLIALNKKVSSIIKELGGTPYPLTIVENKVVLPEALRLKLAEPSKTSPLFEPDSGVFSDSDSSTPDEDVSQNSKG